VVGGPGGPSGRSNQDASRTLRAGVGVRGCGAPLLPPSRYHGVNDRSVQEKIARLMRMTSPSLHWVAPFLRRERQQQRARVDDGRWAVASGGSSSNSVEDSLSSAVASPGRRLRIGCARCSDRAHRRAHPPPTHPPTAVARSALPPWLLWSSGERRNTPLCRLVLLFCAWLLSLTCARGSAPHRRRW
jgi:hypothetical protein